jgi:serine/threonine-protein kinase HipA
MRRLDIYVNERKAGTLTEQGNGYTFRYDSDYLVSDGPSVSVTLSKREEAYKSSTLFPFFTNMMPEGANRKVICRTRKVDERDSFGLLEAMAGKDFIGGVSIKPASK